MKRTCAAVAVLLLVGACTGEQGAASSTAATSTTNVSTSTSAATAPPSTVPDVRFESCAAPPVDVALLCEAVAVIERHHLDPFAPDVLAAAGLLGLEGAVATGDPGGRLPVTCPVPTPEFRDVCEAVGDRVAEGMAPADAIEAVVEGMFRFGLDPYSEYVPPGVADLVIEPGTGLIPWVGLVVSLKDDGGVTCSIVGPGCDVVVESVLSYGSAASEGVLPDDRIRSVDGDPLEAADLNEVVARFARAPGAVTEVVVEREGRRLTKRLTILDLRLEPVESTELLPGIVYLRMNDFTEQAASEVGRVLRTLTSGDDPARGLVLDLRGNPGGLVRSAQAVASQFLSEGAVMVETGDIERVWPVIEGGLAPAIELVVLVDGGTASAAEVVAAALSDAGRAIVIGTPTFGKDIVQDRFDARNGGEFVVSVSRWISPSGRDVGIVGLQPDVLITVDEEGEEDPALIEALRRLGA